MKYEAIYMSSSRFLSELHKPPAAEIKVASTPIFWPKQCAKHYFPYILDEDEKMVLIFSSLSFEQIWKSILLLFTMGKKKKNHKEP